MMVAETARLVLREFQTADCSALEGVFGDAEVMRFGPGVQDAVWVEGWIAKCLESYALRGYGPWAVVEKERERVAGYCGLFYYPNLAGSQEIEIGYRLARGYWGRGYATEAALAVRDFGFNVLGFSRLAALIDPGNLASIRVAVKLGMKAEKEVMLEGYTHPDHLYVV